MIAVLNVSVSMAATCMPAWYYILNVYICTHCRLKLLLSFSTACTVHDCPISYFCRNWSWPANVHFQWEQYSVYTQTETTRSYWLYWVCQTETGTERDPWNSWWWAVEHVADQYVYTLYRAHTLLNIHIAIVYACLYTGLILEVLLLLCSEWLLTGDVRHLADKSCCWYWCSHYYLCWWHRWRASWDVHYHISTTWCQWQCWSIVPLS